MSERGPGAVAAAIRACRFNYANEDTLQQGVAAALVAAGFVVTREARLDSRSRIDLLVDGRIGVEVKIDGTAADVARQCNRYLEHPAIDALVLVTTRARHSYIHEGAGKPFVLVQLAAQGLL